MWAANVTFEIRLPLQNLNDNSSIDPEKCCICKCAVFGEEGVQLCTKIKPAVCLDEWPFFVVLLCFVPDSLLNQKIEELRFPSVSLLLGSVPL